METIGRGLCVHEAEQLLVCIVDKVPELKLRCSTSRGIGAASQYYIGSSPSSYQPLGPQAQLSSYLDVSGQLLHLATKVLF